MEVTSPRLSSYEVAELRLTLHWSFLLHMLPWLPYMVVQFMHCTKCPVQRASQVALVVKNLPANAGDMRYGSHPWVGKTHWRRVWQPTAWGLMKAPLLCLWDSQGKNSRMDSHSLLQKIFPTQGLNQCLLHLLPWQVGFLPLAPPGKPRLQSIGSQNVRHD